MKGHWVRYSAEELAWLESNRDMRRSDLHRFFVMFFDRPEVTHDQIKALCSRKGWKTGRTGCFAKGSVPHNAGKKCAEGKGGRHPNARRTQFRKGQEPHNTRYLGHERVTDDGYIEVSVAETNPHTGYGRRYVLKHRHEWEKVNGPIPEGHALKCLDDDKQNCAPANWIAIPRGVLARLNGGRHRKTLPYREAPAELKPLVLTNARLKHAAHEAEAA